MTVDKGAILLGIQINPHDGQKMPDRMPTA
jgi:hypothetical protein